MSLSERYRPATWADFAGNEKAVAQARGVLARHQAAVAAGTERSGLAYHIAGLSGAGKTTMAMLIARDAGAAPDNPFDYMELDGDKCSVEAVRNLDQSGGFLSCRPWGKARVIVVNECHAMTPRAVQAWLTLLERLPRWAVIIFTSTESLDLFGNFAGPFSRRCVCISLTNQGLAGVFAQRLVTIAEAEKYTLPHKTALAMVQAVGNNLGKAVADLDRLLGEYATSNAAGGAVQA